MKKSGFYIIKDQFFTMIADPYLKRNKEQSRPHYYCLNDSDELLWMIPMSSRVEKYSRIIDQKIKKLGRCDTLHIAKLDNGQKVSF